ALRTLDRLPRRERLRERVHLLAEGGELFVPSPRRLDRGQQVDLAKGLHQITEHACFDGSPDELVLAVRREHDDRDRPLVEDPARRFDPVEARHLDVEDGQVGLVRPSELHCLDPVAGLADDVETGAREHLDEVESDDRLVLGDEAPHAPLSGTATTTAYESPSAPATTCLVASGSTST